MKTDKKGFIVAEKSPRPTPGRIHVAVRAVELTALEKSPNRSLRVLARRMRDAMAESDAWWDEKNRKDALLAEASRAYREKVEADPKLKAEQQERRRAIGALMGFGS